MKIRDKPLAELQTSIDNILTTFLTCSDKHRVALSRLYAIYTKHYNKRAKEPIYKTNLRSIKNRVNGQRTIRIF